MKDYVISIDTTCDLPDSVSCKLSVENMLYAVEADEYGADTGREMDIAEFYAKMREGLETRTSQVSVEDAVQYFLKLTEKGDGVLHLPLAGALSATCDNHIKAAEEVNKLRGEKLVYVTDSLSQAGGLGLLVTLAQLKKESGAEIEECFNYINKIKRHVCHYFVVDDLIYLYRGGRISKASAVIGSFIKIKPLLHTDEQGRLIPIQKILSRKKSLQRLVEKMEERFNHETDIVYISHGDCIEDAEYVARAIEKKFGITPVLMPLCRVVGCHSGPGTVALFFTADTRLEK